MSRILRNLSLVAIGALGSINVLLFIVSQATA